MKVINYLCDYLSKVGAPKRYRESLKANWYTGVQNRLGEYKGKRFVERRRVLSETGIRLRWSDESRMIYNEGDSLWVASAVPPWRQGWAGHIKNEEIRDLVSNYVHFITQFWHRCNVTPVLVYIWYRYNEPAEWVGSSPVHAQAFSGEQFGSNQRDKRITAFLRQVNCHHPLVHNACYHYLRMRQLLARDFVEDALVNMDCIASLARKRNLELGGPGTDLSRFNIHANQTLKVNRLHELRNEFAAHPSMTKWWDFSEMFSDDIEEYVDLSLALILQVAKSYSGEKPVEQTFAGITNAPKEFHDCFWFNRIPLSLK